MGSHDGHIEYMKDPWKGLAVYWASCKPFYKPSLKEMGFFEKPLKEFLEYTPNPKVLLFGATPEFRDLLGKYRLDVTMVDINPEAVKEMDSLATVKNPNEKLAVKNWLELDFPDENFDIICADSTQDNLPFETHADFFRNIYRMLKEDGLFFFASVYKNPSLSITPRQIVERYKENPAYYEDFQNRIHDLFVLGTSQFFDKEKHYFKFSDVNKAMHAEIRAQGLPPEAETLLTFDAREEGYIQVHSTLADFEEQMSGLFEELDSYVDNSHHALSNMKIAKLLRKI
ncbi:methyltransferase domain-containing protein [Candidatus Micrarchaeota archaeon]|nr:methyltransferase domain-containing protein [Candidatus Micrarchaeota archaeon]MBD3418429.1 methyltransferase domain-containing protein [Candidatus Micrarchaeota archaeon]